MEKKGFEIRPFLEKHRAILGQGAVVFALILSFILLSLWSGASEKPPALDPLEERGIEEANEVESEEPDEIFIHVAGEVRNPGLVRLKSGARVCEAIDQAGGLTEKADLSEINLASKCEDGMKIVVGNEEDAQAVKETYESGQKANLININTADLSSLMDLPGIGEVTAKNIIKYREENGGFKTKDEIKKVTRIGEKTYEKIEEMICV